MELDNEKLLLEAVRSGDKEAFKDLVHPLITRAYRTAFAILRSSHLAEEALQNSLIELYKTIMTGKEIHNLHGWFSRLIAKRSLDLLRHENLSRKTIATIAIPVDRSKLLHNRVIQPNQALPITPSDPDIQELKLEKLTVQPITMNAIIAVKEGWSLDFPMYQEDSPYFHDDKGNKYPYNPGGPVLMMDQNKLQLPFSSSVFFDEGADNLKLHIGTVQVSEQHPSGSFDLSINDSFPKTVRFKNKQFVIESAESHDGYLFLKIKKERPEQTRLDGVRFVIEDYFEQLKNNKNLGDQLDTLRVKLDIAGWETTVNGWKRPYLELYIPAPKQDHFHISLQRIYDPITVNKDFPVTLK
jgi:DNA-directed RNA polymerase specialized sigma24 family protein